MSPLRLAVVQTILDNLRHVVYYVDIYDQTAIRFFYHNAAHGYSSATYRIQESDLGDPHHLIKTAENIDLLMAGHGAEKTTGPLTTEDHIDHSQGFGCWAANVRHQPDHPKS